MPGHAGITGNEKLD
jgi:hypothetical protein